MTHQPPAARIQPVATDRLTELTAILRRGRPGAAGRWPTPRVRLIGTNIEGRLIERNSERMTVHFDGAPTCCDRLASEVEVLPEGGDHTNPKGANPVDLATEIATLAEVPVPTTGRDVGAVARWTVAIDRLATLTALLRGDVDALLDTVAREGDSDGWLNDALESAEVDYAAAEGALTALGGGR